MICIKNSTKPKNLKFALLMLFRFLKTLNTLFVFEAIFQSWFEDSVWIYWQWLLTFWLLKLIFVSYCMIKQLTHAYLITVNCFSVMRCITNSQNICFNICYIKRAGKNRFVWKNFFYVFRFLVFRLLGFSVQMGWWNLREWTSCIVHSRSIHPCHMVPHCPLLQCPHPCSLHCVSNMSALCDILYKRLRNTITYLLSYLPTYLLTYILLICPLLEIPSLQHGV